MKRIIRNVTPWVFLFIMVAGGQRPVYGQYVCNAISWHEKSIEFNALQHKYYFKGSWGQGDARLEFNLIASYGVDPATLGFDWYPGAGAGGSWTELITVATANSSAANYCVTVKGRSDYDPWLNPYATVSETEVSQEGFPGAGTYCSMLYGISDKPLSRCAPTPAEMLQWGIAARNVGPAPCTGGLCAPEISRPDAEAAYPDVPAAVAFQFRIPCKFSNYQGKNFVVMIEYQEEDGNWHLPGWMEYLHEVDMVPLPGMEQFSIGDLSVPFDRPGHYRVKAMNNIYLDPETIQEHPQLAGAGAAGTSVHGLSACRTFWVGQDRLREAMKKQLIALGPETANLAIGAMEVREIAAGENLQGKAADSRRVQVSWKVVNNGRAKADAHVLSTACVSTAGASCPPGLSGYYDIPELPPPADGIAEWIVRSEIVPVPDGVFNWRFGARVDKHQDVRELDETDNSHEGEYRGRLAEAARGISRTEVSGALMSGRNDETGASASHGVVNPIRLADSSAPAAPPPVASFDPKLHVTSPGAMQYFPDGSAVPVTLDFNCCGFQKEVLMSNYFDVEIERYSWDNLIPGRFWDPHLSFRVDMTPCYNIFAPCQGAKIVDLTQGLSGDPTNAPPADAIAYRIKARGCPLDPETHQVHFCFPWSDWVPFGVGTAPSWEILKKNINVMSQLGQDDGVKSGAGQPTVGPSVRPKPDSSVPAAVPAAALKSATAVPVSNPEPTGAPVIRLETLNMVAPARVKLIVRADSRFPVNYVLEKKDDGSYRKIRSSSKPEFDVAEPGEYRVKARYAGGFSDGIIAFTIKPAKAATPAAKQPKTQIIPSKRGIKMP